MIVRESMRRISLASTGTFGSRRLACGSRIRWFLELKSFCSKTIATCWDSLPAILSPMRRHVWFAPCFGNIGSVRRNKNVPKEFGGGANLSGPMHRHSFGCLVAVSESWVSLLLIIRYSLEGCRRDSMALGSAAGSALWARSWLPSIAHRSGSILRPTLCRAER
jgi:hypothetical protein